MSQSAQPFQPLQPTAHDPAVASASTAPVAWVHLPAVSAASPAAQTVLQFLQSRYAHVPAERWLARVEAHEVCFENGEPVHALTPYQGNRRVRYLKTLPTEPRIPFAVEIVYEDEQIVVAYKPHFLPVVPGAEFVQETLVYRLRQTLNCPELVPAHRLDRDTAGLVLLCKQPQTRGLYQRLFQQRAVKKRYLAVAHARSGAPFYAESSGLQRWEHCLGNAAPPAPWFMVAVQPEGGKPNALTHVRIMTPAVESEYAYLCLEPVTGRKHQLRVQAAHEGFPLRNDRFYPQMQPKGPDDYAEPLQLLAYELAFEDPLSGAWHHLTSPHHLKDWPEDVLRLPALLR